MTREDLELGKINPRRQKDCVLFCSFQGYLGVEAESSKCGTDGES